MILRKSWKNINSLTQLSERWLDYFWIISFSLDKRDFLRSFKIMQVGLFLFSLFIYSLFLHYLLRTFKATSILRMCLLPTCISWWFIVEILRANVPLCFYYWCVHSDIYPSHRLITLSLPQKEGDKSMPIAHLTAHHTIDLLPVVGQCCPQTSTKYFMCSTQY